MAQPVSPLVEQSDGTSTERQTVPDLQSRRIPVWVPLVVTALAAALLRLTALDAVGFAEDEIDIIRAVDAYRHLDFSANAEHPMLAKLLAFASVQAADGWNAAAQSLHLPAVSPETALRLPMALAGALTTVALFLLAHRLFGLTVAAWAAFLWAFDVNALAINRTAKEDTLFLLFLLTAAWLYERGKFIGRDNPLRAQRSYIASGASFGLMLASKYLPGYFGIYAIFNIITDPEPGPNYPHKRPFYLALALAFAAGNVALFSPASWHHLAAYLQGHTLTHHGYRFAQHLYVNDVGATPWGLPWMFYLIYLALKTPLLILTAFVAGVICMLRNPHVRGFVFARVFLLFFLLPFSLIAAKFVRYMLPLFAVVDLLAAIGIAWLLSTLSRRAQTGARIATFALGSLFLASPLVAVAASAPYFGLYGNAVHTRIAPPGYFFTDDEFNDAQVREAVTAIARAAKPGAVILSDANGVVAEYLELNGRTDMQSLSLSRSPLPSRDAEAWAIVQDGHVYFENEATITAIRARLLPWWEFKAHGAVAAQVFRLFDR